MSDMNTSIDYSIDGSHVAAAHDFGGEGETGAEPSVESPSGYVSDAELLAWLEAKSTGQNDELREQMKISTARQDLIKDLNNLKSAIEHVASPEEAEAIKETMKALLNDDKYIAYREELTTLFGPAIDELDHSVGDQGMEATTKDLADVATLSALKDPIANETNKLDKIDGLALVQIQQLVSDAKETSQLASNVLSSRDQTASSIIGNIRG